MPILSYFPGGGSGEVTVSLPAVPTQKGALTYTGSPLFPQWSDYDPDTLSVSGTLSAVNAGEYTAVFVPKVGYCWADETVEPKAVLWRVEKAEGVASVDVSSIVLDSTSPSSTFTVTRAGDGDITAVSSDPAVATVFVSGTAVTVTFAGGGVATVTVYVSEDANHTSPQPITVAVTAVSVWKKYATASTTTHELWIPSQELTLEELEGEIEADDYFIDDNADGVWTDLPSTLVSYYLSVSLDGSGNMVGGSATTLNKAKYLNREGKWYYVAENTMSLYQGNYSGEMKVFELEVNSHTVYTKGDYIEDVTSPDPSAYPDNGVFEGYWYLKMQGDMTVTDDGEGNVIILNSSVADDGNGNLTLMKGE